MYLKRLDILGFKSFQARTLFEFGTGITAIIGPNGSGKSNVGEAIRWVLGEPASRSLRARRLEDVIFSGSSQKAAVGMAEVSITLDNSEGWLPLDYNEVVVSRRAYRNGESEYLINKTKVRLRDVLDLFLRAQIGQNSYAFMGQGLVDEVLVMRPDERRRLLEEAADVRLLRSRLDEARDRLAATRDNLERVQLLLDEIGPRLTQLERQASRAVEHSRLSRELADTLHELYTLQWDQVQEALIAAQATHDQKQQELLVCRDELKAFEEGLTALSTAVEEREKELGIRRVRHQELSDQVHGLELAMRFDRERVEAQTRRRAEVEAELLALRHEHTELQESLETLRERARKHAPELERTRELAGARRTELEAVEREQGDLRRREAEEEERLERARRGYGESERGLARLSAEEQRTRDESRRHTVRRDQILEHLASVGLEFHELSFRLRQVGRDVEGLERERRDLVGALERSRTLVHDFESETLQIEAALAQLRVREELLTRLQNVQEGVDAGARFLLSDDSDADAGGQARQIEGLVGLVRDLIRVPAGLERAIEAALAENLQALVFENYKAAAGAIEVLEQHQAGRALMYPLDGIRTTPPLNLLRERGVVGVAARLVRCEARFRPLVDLLLGRTIVVETAAFAQQVLSRGLGSAVSLDGVLFRPNGAVAGGLSRISVEAIGRHRELQELPSEIESLAFRRSDAEARLRGEREALTRAAGLIGQLEPRLQALRDERSRRQDAFMENRSRLIILRGEARALWSDLRRAELTLDWRGRRMTLEADKERFESEGRAAAEELERDRAALTQLTERRNATLDALSEATAAQATLEGEARSLGREVQQLQASLGRAQDRLGSREQTLIAIDRELETISSRSQTSAAALAAAREEFSGLTSEMAPAEEEHRHLVGRERSMREQLAAARTRLLEAERAAIESGAAVNRREDELEALRSTMAAEGLEPRGRDVRGAERPSSDRPGGRLPPIRGAAEVDAGELRARVSRLRNQIRALGPVNEQAQADYGESRERFDFLKGQVDDLQGSEETLLTAIDELESNIRERLKSTFAVVDREFQRYFEAFFNGGRAHLGLTNPDDYANSGIDIVAQPPGKRVSTLAMLSGGERTLTALALLLSLLEAHPSPICVLDEVDAALDERNVGRFVEALQALEKKTQFIIVTHNPRTIEAADFIYGVSMGADSTSRVLSVRLGDPQSN